MVFKLLYNLYWIYIKDKLNSSPSKLKIDWIPYSQIKNLEKIAEGGFGIIYKAKIDGKVVAVKGFLNSQDPSNDFLNELKSLYQCYDEKFECIIRCHGITKNPLTNEFMFIMKFANGGNLYNYLHDNFTNITWKEKLYILWRISDGLQTIHEKDFIHRDFHSGNILIEIIENGSCKVDQYLIGDLGLSQPANNTSSNNEIYGVIPYIAPEVFKGAKFSKASDIYSMGMIMWELTTGCKPFANIEHDSNFIYEIIDGKRPEITDDTPEDFANLMRKCWNSDPKKRPLAKKICETVNHWLTTKDDDHIFNQAEEIRLELIKSKSLGPEFSKPRHSHAIYTSRPLNSLISKSSVISSMTSFNMKTKDSIIQNSNIQYCSNSLNSETNPLRKRNIEELNVEIQDNGKHIKISDEIDKEIKE
ncbi:Cdc15p [Rhizophagus irregularis DAOM 197198w]|uniref:Cdc15p n=1 Tax=Rhizophagus irregularis (strain DAOM 197198w) TaxID=1432141 RepID=A0A015MS55_RHIIW|nr:Cdc15p [Rhizophagus irregularis DAOM 197198w]